MAPAPDLSLDRASDVPLGTQLAWQLRTAIATGLLRPGERLPGVRELAESAAVNVNTVRAVYGRLEEQGLVASEHGRGTFVAPDAPRRAGLGRIAAAAAAQAREAGLDPRDLAEALFVGGASAEPASSGTGEKAGPQADERMRRRELRSEIAELERELVHLDGPGALAEPHRPAAGRILTAAELQDVRDGLAGRIAQLRDARAEAHRRVEAERAAERYAPASSTWRHAGTFTGTSRPGVIWTGK